MASVAGCSDKEVSLSEDGKSAPNVILIMADDLGYGDLGAYGQKTIHTPHLDQMAKEGTVFTDFYSGSTVCAPSRYVLMTGHHTGQAYVRGNVGWSRGDLPLRQNDVSIADLAKKAGYATGVYGKWSLGLENTTGGPHKQGFDQFFGYIDQTEAHHYYVSQLQQIVAGKTVNVPVDSTSYSHDLFAEAALEFIDEHKEEPFFLYLPFTLPHADLIVPDEALEPYLNAEGESIFPETPFPGSGYRSQPMPFATYAAMVSRLDRDVGRIINRLKKHGLSEDTIVLFTSDNGPHSEAGGDPAFFDSNGPLRGMKRDLYEGGIRVPMIAWGPGSVPAGRKSAHPWAMWDLLPTVADLMGTKPPANINGLSMAPALTDKGQPPAHDYLYWEFKRGNEFRQALRQNNWKAVRFTQKDGSQRLELYNLADDLGETTNLADKHPKVARRLNRLINKAHQTPAWEEFRFAAVDQNSP